MLSCELIVYVEKSNLWKKNELKETSWNLHFKEQKGYTSHVKLAYLYASLILSHMRKLFYTYRIHIVKFKRRIFKINIYTKNYNTT